MNKQVPAFDYLASLVEQPIFFIRLSAVCAEMPSFSVSSIFQGCVFLQFVRVSVFQKSSIDKINNEMYILRIRMANMDSYFS